MSTKKIAVSEPHATAETMLEAALELARAGYEVFPLYPASATHKTPIGKRPRCDHGHNDATTDEAQIERWWSEPERGTRDAWQCSPDNNIGIAVPEGMVIVDIDPRNGGWETLEKIEAEHGLDWAMSLTANTGGDGKQIYLSCEPGRRFPKNLDGHFGPGIDLKQCGGYVVAPPSKHKSGGAYAWDQTTGDIAPAPAWLTLLSKVKSKSDGAPAPAVPDGAELDDLMRDKLDRAIEAIEPFYAEGEKHYLALAVGGYFRNKSLPAIAARYVVSQLPSEDYNGRIADAVWAWGPDVHKPRGAAELRERWPELLTTLDALRLDLLEHARDKREARKAAENDDPMRTAGKSAADTAEPEHGGHDPAVDHVIARLADPACGVYQRAGLLVTINREAHNDQEIVRPNGAPTIRHIVPARLREIIRMTSGPRDAPLAGDVIARGEWSHIRPLDAIVTYPVLRKDGTILNASGYDASTRTLADMRVGVAVPDQPTLANARAALELLTCLVSDFPFEAPAHRSAWLAALLTVPARPAIEGPTPMLLLDASARGSGKTMLADLISIIATGEDATRRTAPETAEEWRKVIYAMLLAGDPICLIDNVTRMLASAALDAMLTGTTYKDRVLGVSEERSIAVRTVMIASANNCRVSSDLVRRSLHCRIDPNVERPELRTGFQIPDLLAHVRRERAALLGAALTIVRAYAVAGRPPVKARPMGSYGAWCRVVRDALVWAGGGDPAETQDALREDADVERDELRDLLSAWHGLLGDQAITVRELLEAARTGRKPDKADEPDDKPARVTAPGGRFAPPTAEADALADALRGIMPSGIEPSTHAVGKRLQSLRSGRSGGLVLRQRGVAHGGGKRWQVAKE
ncbi:MAG: bifunctional DNA primase/polymerase [Myxococcales bacterium]|nr:MAG: bifunctional DNA primase/polymerase [Myxococcales bacterium]